MFRSRTHRKSNIRRMGLYIFILIVIVIVFFALDSGIIAQNQNLNLSLNSPVDFPVDI